MGFNWTKGSAAVLLLSTMATPATASGASSFAFLKIHSFLLIMNRIISSGRCSSENRNNFLELPLSLSW